MSCYLCPPPHFQQNQRERSRGEEFWGVCGYTGISSQLSGVGKTRELNREREDVGYVKRRRITHSLSFIPSLDLAEVIVRPGGQFKRKFKPKQPIGEFHEIEQLRNLFFHLRRHIIFGTHCQRYCEHNLIPHLRWHTEHVRVILHESPDPRQPSERARRLVPMDNTKFRHPDRELLVTPIPRVKDETMPRAVHRFQSPLLLLDIEREHVILVILPMSRSLPEFAIVHIRGDN